MRWIKCSDAIPNNEQFVLAWNGRGIPVVLQFFVKHQTEESIIWFQQTLIAEKDTEDGMKFGLDDFSFWQPLPSPPED